MYNNNHDYYYTFIVNFINIFINIFSFFVAKIFNILSCGQNMENETVHFLTNFAILSEFLPNYAIY